MVSEGSWYSGFPTLQAQAKYNFTREVVQHDMYDILYSRVAFIKNHLSVYAWNGGVLENTRRNGLFDLYLSLRLYCLDTFSTSDEEIDSIYFVEFISDTLPNAY